MTTAQPYLDFAQKHLDVVNISGDELMFRCPVHDDSRASAQFNVHSGLWCCFGCHEGGSIKRLCRELGITPLSEPEPQLDDLYRKLRELKHPTKEHRLDMPETSLRRYDLPTRYWAGRGFRPETIKAFDLGMDMMSNAATIPLRGENGNLLGVIKRYLDDDCDLRYRYPKGFKRSHNLFGSWMVEHHPSDLVVLTEGSVDAMKVWQAGFPGCAVYGSSISPEQIRLLRRLGVGQVVLFFDNDRAGKQATELCQGRKTRVRKGKKFVRYDPRTDLRRWFLVSQVDYRSGWPSDPGAMTDDQIRRAVKKARLLNF
jgi:DNA primase